MKPMFFLWIIFVAFAVFASEPEISKHGLFNIDCKVCHTDELYSKPSMEVCTGCHDGFNKLALSTEKYGRYNPHQPHEPYLDDIECADCHSMHDESSSFCLVCHDDADFSVP